MGDIYEEDVLQLLVLLEQVEAVVLVVLAMPAPNIGTNEFAVVFMIEASAVTFLSPVPCSCPSVASLSEQNELLLLLPLLLLEEDEEKEYIKER